MKITAYHQLKQDLREDSPLRQVSPKIETGRELIEQFQRAKLPRVIPLNITLAEIERFLLMRAMEMTEGNITQAGELLGLQRTTMASKLSLYGIRRHGRAEVGDASGRHAASGLTPKLK